MSSKEKVDTTRRGAGFGGGRRMMRAGEKPKDFKKTMKKLIEYLSPYKKSVIVVIVFAIVSTVFTILGPRILGNITNQIADDYVNIVVYEQIVDNLPQGVKLPKGTTGEDILKMVPSEMISKVPQDRLDKIKNVDFSKKPHIQFDIIGKTILLLIGLYLVSTLFSYLQGWIVSGMAQKISYDLRKKILNKIHRLPLKYFDNQTHGEVLSRITNDVDTVGQTLNQGITQMITSVTMILGS